MGSVFIAVNEFFEHQEDPETISSLAVFSILLMFNIALYQIYSKITEFLILEKERTVYIQQMKMISRNTNEQKRIMKDFQEEKHNLINELIVLKNSALNGNSKDVIDNLDKIICNFDKIRTISNSGNTTVDAIINFKYAAANSEGIQFKTSIIIPESLPINSCDLGIVLGNAIDNAIEATGECEISDRIIEIYVGIKKEALIIIIKNPYVHEIILDSKGNIKSTKEDSERHGYGIISMKKVVEKYCGDMLIESKDNIFIMTAIMNMGDFNSKYRKFDT